MWGPAPISARRLRSLIAGLPPTGTALARSMGEITGWGNTEELLALVAELVDAGNRMFFTAHSKKGTSAPKPVQVRRPTALDEPDATPKRRQATSEELKAWFGATGGSVRYTGPRSTAPAP